MFASIERTLANGKVPTAERIIEDFHRIPDTTLQRIIDAKGCYIEDQVHGKKTRTGARGKAQLAYRQAQREKLELLNNNLVEAMCQLHDNVANKTIPVPLVMESVTETTNEEHHLSDDEENDDVVDEQDEDEVDLVLEMLGED